MAIIVDAARNADAIVACAAQPAHVGTARDTDFDQSFDIYQSAIETHITARADVTPWVGINNTADSEAPQVDYETAPFWFPKTAATWRPA